MDKINVVLEGRYKGAGIWVDENCVDGDCNRVSRIKVSGLRVDKGKISSYEIIDETNKSEYSFWKGALGAVLFGGAGAFAGMGKRKEYLIAIEWIYPKNTTNNKSLILIDERLYKVFIRSMF